MSGPALQTARLALALACVWLGACSNQELHSRLGERQANDMVSALRNACLDAGKEAREGGLFAVMVKRGGFSKAVEVLRAHGLPREDYDSMTSMFPAGGIVPSQVGERARFAHALSQEIARTLSNIDGVFVARVHLSLPEKDPLSDKVPQAAASVFVKHRAGLDLSGQLGRIKALVVNSVQGLAYDNVTVAFFPAEPEQPASSACGDVNEGVWWSLGTGIALLCIGGAWWGWRRSARLRKKPASLARIKP